MESQETSAEKVNYILEAASEMMKSAGLCFLTTIGENGLPNIRLMQPFLPEADLTVWFGASAFSRKVREIRNDNRAVLAYQLAEENAYITLLGHTQVVDNLELRRRYWMEAWIDFYTGGPASDEYILIRFEPERIEIMNFKRQIHPEPFGLAPAVLDRKKNDKTWHLAAS
jgi:general stress protein 26